MATSATLLSVSISFDKADHALAEFPWFLEIHDVAGSHNHLTTRTGNASFDRAGMRMHVGDVGIPDEKQRRHMNLVQSGEGRLAGKHIIRVAHILRICRE